MHPPDPEPGTASSAPDPANRSSTGTAPQDVDAQAIPAGHRLPAWSRESQPLDLALAEGMLAETTFLAALARRLGVAFTLEPPPPAGTPRAEESLRFRSYAATDAHGRPCRVIAPNAALAAMLLGQHRTAAPPALVLTTRQRLVDRLLEADGEKIAQQAATGLPAALSARHSASAQRKSRLLGWVFFLMLAALLTISLVYAPGTTLILPPLVLAPAFILAAIAALTATIESSRPAPPLEMLSPARLPRYSVLVPLYRESNIVPALIERLSALDYPRDRLEILILIEADDAETLAALEVAALPPWFLVLRLPAGMPRTKPRALNAALPFCTGSYLVVYDAEDAPEADQLLRAASRFGSAEPEVACLQARLGISNSFDGFLTRRFAIDYAALFDCIKAGSAHAGWAVPLGGSSNHFRCDALRAVGGWDAWNVTEDADLGIRLARSGWRVEDLASTTWEEAPNTLAAWLNQRTRWMKGWMQTVAVHLRQPRALVTALGGFRAMVIGSTAFAVLIGAALYPVFLAAVIFRLIDPLPLGGGGTLLTLADAMLIVTLATAVLVEIVPATVALRRRKGLYLLPFVLLAPVTHLLVSFAVWRAMLELVRRPFHWHKTMHGKAKREGRLAALDE